MINIRRQLYSVLITLSAISSVSCYTHTRNALPEQYVGEAEIAGMPGIRAWGDEHSEAFQKDFVQSIQQEIESKTEGYKSGDATFDVLALSGGGSYGAFAAGVLNGWDATGTALFQACDRNKHRIPDSSIRLPGRKVRPKNRPVIYLNKYERYYE